LKYKEKTNISLFPIAIMELGFKFQIFNHITSYSLGIVLKLL